jgi:release factor glutamine methyltransferase
MPDEPMTFAESSPLGALLDAAARWLKARGIDEARLPCELLATRILRLPRLQLPLEQARRLAPWQVAALRRGVLRLGAHEPIQYILGEWDFRGLTLKVDRRALIPRPETEQLVQRVLDQPEIWRAPAPRLCDIGTGSGCIAVGLAVEAPRGHYVAVDREAAALDLARENAKRHGVASRITFLHGENCAHLPPATLDAVVSNPPYIASPVCETLSTRIRDFEPRSALDGGADGLKILRNLIPDAAMVLKPHGWCFLEIGLDQGEAVRALLAQAGFTEIAIARDLAGMIRFARARMP